MTEPITVPASDVVAALDYLREQLDTVGIRAEADPRDLNPPCAWLTADMLTTPAVLCGSASVSCSVYLLTPDTGFGHSVTALNSMLALALSVLDPSGDIDLRQAVALPSGGDPAPAFKIPVTVQVIPNTSEE